MCSFNKAHRDEDQMYQKQIFLEFYYTALYNKELIKVGFSATQTFVCIFVKCYENLKITTYLLVYIWSKLLSSSLDALLKLFKTSSPQKLFDYDCVTLHENVSKVSLTVLL